MNIIVNLNINLDLDLNDELWEGDILPMLPERIIRIEYKFKFKFVHLDLLNFEIKI